MFSKRTQPRSIVHEGVKRRSGRYPWGSGEEPNQRDSGTFLSTISDLKAKGFTEVEIAKSFGMNTRELRDQRSIASSEKRAADSTLAIRLRDKGYSDSAIAERMNVDIRTARSLLDPVVKARAASTAMTAEVLKDAVDSKKYIDVGVGTEQHLGVSRTKLNTAVAILQEQGYVLNEIQFEQGGTGKFTKMKILSPPGTDLHTVSSNRKEISMVDDYSEDLGRSYLGLEPIRNINSNRISIRFHEEGGSEKDGVLELKRGVPELDLGGKAYAQVRVGVDGTHYMKGMAMYSDGPFPKGKDIIYNTNKTKDRAAKVFKPMEEDADNPFGTTLRQKHYIDADGKRQLSALNIVGSKEGAGEEGAWGKWSKTISSQVLAKQTPALAAKQLKLVVELKKDEFDDIMSITNPTIRKALLTEFADSADAAAIHLKAAALPRQASQVLLPFSSIKENEIYAPNFRPGETVVLIRHPHGGIFEIPSLKVNNSNPEAIKTIGDAKDAVGINPKVALKLSGADFDGDTVIVIPNNNKYIKTAESLKGLVDFDSRAEYKNPPGTPKMKDGDKQLEMGKISNLITDMTIKGASPAEISRAVRHSMVVIDAQNHDLNYKQSYRDHGISALKKRYQGKSTGGAATLLSKAKSAVYVDQLKEGQFIKDPITGKTKRVYVDADGYKLFEPTGATYKTKDGKIVTRLSKIPLMARTKDAKDLSSGTVMENIYANHANELKSIALQARKIVSKTNDAVYVPSARTTFKTEVESLKSKLSLALRNKPLERKAQLMANYWVSLKRKANPDLSRPDVKKLKGQALEEARIRFGAKKAKIVFTDREWFAIQAGALSSSSISMMIRNADKPRLKSLAVPITKLVMTSPKASRARAMLANGHTRLEIADALGVPLAVIDAAFEEK